MFRVVSTQSTVAVGVVTNGQAVIVRLLLVNGLDAAAVDGVLVVFGPSFLGPLLEALPIEDGLVKDGRGQAWLQQVRLQGHDALTLGVVVRLLYRVLLHPLHLQHHSL